MREVLHKEISPSGALLGSANEAVYHEGGKIEASD